MGKREFLQVDPAELRLPGGRLQGVDPLKLQRQVARHGTSIAGMPPPEVKRGADGEFMIFDGVTRATRVAKYLAGVQITVEVTGNLTGPVGSADGRKHDMKKIQQTRSELIDALSQLCQLRPEWRLGQTIANLATTAGKLDTGGVWDLEDDEALAAARTLIEQYAESESLSAESKVV